MLGFCYFVVRQTRIARKGKTKRTNMKPNVDPLYNSNASKARVQKPLLIQQGHTAKDNNKEQRRASRSSRTEGNVDLECPARNYREKINLPSPALIVIVIAQKGE